MNYIRNTNFSYIYVLCDPNTNEIRYVGQTINPQTRLSSHIRSSQKNKTHLHRWILSLKGQSPVIEIIDCANENEKNNLEQYWIFSLKQMGYRLVNLANGGEGGNNISWTKERREEQREKMLGKKLSPEWCRAIGEGQKRAGNQARVFSEDTRKKIGDAARLRGGHPNSQETRKKISNSKKGRPVSLSEESERKRRENAALSQSRPEVRAANSERMKKYWEERKKIKTLQ